MKTHSRYEVARKILLFWCLFIGIGAVAGSIGMFVAPDGSALGMQSIISAFQVLPFADVLFQNFIFPGIALLIVNGISNLIAAYFLVRKQKLGVILGAIFGVTLMLWICIQFVIFEFNFMSTAYFIFGLAQAITGYAAWVFYQQEHFTIDMADYPNIGKSDDQLVVYFSRMGYVKKQALQRANELGAQVYEVTTPEHTQGTLGFWWCGRFGMHGWPMKINPIPLALESYEKVTICSPVWVFSLCAPMKGFLVLAKGKIKRADYILVHHQKSKYEKIVAYMDDALGIKHENALSLCCRKGKYIKSRDV